MTVMGFESFEEMQKFLQEQRDAADKNLHPAQRAIDFGDHWVRFANVAAREVEFGYVYTLDEGDELERKAGASEAEVRAAHRLSEEGMKDNMLYGRAFIFWQPGGESCYSHKAAVWPIEKRLFDMAREVDWDIDRLDTVGRTLLTIAHSAWVAHNRSLV